MLTSDGRVAVAGTADGSLLLFDTNEPALGRPDRPAHAQAASFSTGGRTCQSWGATFGGEIYLSLLFSSLFLSPPPSSAKDGLPLVERHASPIVAVMMVEGNSAQHTSHREARSFQVVSVDEVGEVRTWTAVFLARPSTSGSLDDLGVWHG